MKAFGYVRLSKETEDTTSPQRQRNKIKRLCKERGWDLVHVYEDLDVSAFNGKHRPAFEQMMSRLSDVDAIVFWRVDRLARSVSHFSRILDDTQAAQVALVSTDQPIDTASAMGKAFVQMTAVFAELEAGTTSERSRQMVAHKREQDEWLGRAPYGWRIVDKHLVTDTKQQRVLRQAAKAYISGDTWTAIAERHGFKAPAIIRSIMRSPRVRDMLGDLGLDLHAAIRAREQVRAPTSKSLLGGIARCAMCGEGLRRSSTRAARGGKWMSYRCHVVAHVGIAAPWLDRYVSDAVLDAIDIKALVKRARERERQPATADVLAIQARIEELEDAFGDGTLDKQAFTRQRDRQREKLAAAEQAVADDAVSNVPLDLARNLPERWDGMSVDGRRDVIRALVREVRVSKADGNGPIDPKRVEVVWR